MISVSTKFIKNTEITLAGFSDHDWSCWNHSKTKTKISNRGRMFCIKLFFREILLFFLGNFKLNITVWNTSLFISPGEVPLQKISELTSLVNLFSSETIYAIQFPLKRKNGLIQLKLPNTKYFIHSVFSHNLVIFL